MIRIFAALSCATALCLAALPAVATCAGPSLLDRFSPDERAALDTAAAATPYGKGLIWRAEQDGREVLFVGTMHLHDPRHDATMAALADDLATADLILLEMTPVEERQMMTAMAEQPEIFFITEGPTLPDQLDPEVWKNLRDAARERQVPGFLAAKSQPWFLMMSLALPPCAMGDLIAGRFGLDKMIIARAEAQGVPMAALEPWTTLPGLMADIPADEQLEMLALSLLVPDIQEEAFIAMLDSYFAGQVAQIWEMSRQSTRFIPDMTQAEADAAFALTEDLLLTRRNTDWMPVILEAAATHDRLVVAVGAAHLPGTNGLLYLMQQAGWTLSPQG